MTAENQTHSTEARANGRADLWALDGGEHGALTASVREFAEGGHYGFEIPGINSLPVLEAVLSVLSDDLPEVVRLNETRGAFLLPEDDIRAMLRLCRSRKLGILFSVGPRPEYDRMGAFSRSEFGLEVGRRLCNLDAYRSALEEVFWLCRLGCRGIIVYDLGLIRSIGALRKEGALPSDLYIKASTHCVVGNPTTAQIYEENGVDSITVIHDASLRTIQAFRQALSSTAIDVPVDAYASKGGFLRFYEVGKIVAVASPVMLKVGASVQRHPYSSVGVEEAKEKVKRAKVVQEFLTRSGASGKILEDGARARCIPALDER